MTRHLLLVALATLAIFIATPIWAQDQVTPGSTTASETSTTGGATATAISDVVVNTPPPVVHFTAPRPNVTIQETPDNVQVYVEPTSVTIQPQNITVNNLPPSKEGRVDWFWWFIIGVSLLAFIAYLIAAFSRGKYEERIRIENQQRDDRQYTATEDHRHAEELHRIGLEYKGFDVALGGGRFRSVVSGTYRQFDAQGVVSAATSTPEPKTAQPADPAKTADFDKQIRVVRDDISDLKRRSADTDKQITGIRGDVHSLLAKIGKGSPEPKTAASTTTKTGDKKSVKKPTTKAAAAPAPTTPTTTK